MSKRIFITGGAGYIGTHSCVELINSNYEIMVFDDLRNDSLEAIRRVERLTNSSVNIVIGDIKNRNELNKAMSAFKPDSVMHFAGLKAAGGSVLAPLSYYDVNVHGSINVLEAMAKIGCYEIIFSSSATVYGELNKPLYKESMPVAPVSPYGNTKLMDSTKLHSLGCIPSTSLLDGLSCTYGEFLKIHREIGA